MHMSFKTKKRIGSIVYHTLVIAFGFIMIYPVLWLVASSFKPANDIFGDAATIIPKRIDLSNYAKGWAGFGGLTFATFFKNSIFLTVVTVIGQVISSTVVAYSFSRIKFKGKKFWFTCMIITMLMPAQILMIPQYIEFQSLGWLNTYLPMLVPAFTGLPFFIFLIMQFIDGIPKSLDESAFIDGCSKIQTFGYIILPLVKPAVITSAIFSFYWKWDDFMGPLLYLQSPKLYTVSLALKSFSDPSAGTNWGAMFAMLTASLIPSFLIFIFFQKYIVEGIATTGMKN
jgi:multiple sugar transport system permease protein